MQLLGMILFFSLSSSVSAVRTFNANQMVSPGLHTVSYHTVRVFYKRLLLL